MTTLAFARYVEKMLEKVESDDETEIQLPISEINDVPVTCLLEVNLDEETCEVNIYYKYLGTYSGVSEVLFTQTLEPDDEIVSYVTKEGKINCPEEFAEKIKKITTLKFDHFHGNFTFGEIEDSSFLKEMFECENVKLDFDECVICYRNTKTKTNCDHHICHECWGKLPASCVSCKTGRKCPTCRNERIEHCFPFCVECNDIGE